VTGLADATDETFWQSPTWGVSIDWDEDEWAFGGELIEDGFEGVHLRTLSTGIFLEAFERFEGDPQACLESAVREIGEQPGITEAVAVSDRPFPVSKDARGAAQMLEVSASLADGTPYRAINYVECRTVVPGVAVVRITWVAPVGAFDEDLPLVEELFATIQMPREISPMATPKARQATPVASPSPLLATPVA
jgi:hypothetical protein